MADDQVKYSELLVKDEDVFANLIKELGEVKTKISELKTEASGLGGVLKNISTATREQQQATAANAKSVELLAQKTKDLAATKKNLEDATKRFGNLTDEEVGRLDRLATKLKFSSQWQEATAKLVDTTNMSYNEMKATLAVLTNALHTFGTEEKKNSDEAKALENAIERVRDAMKDLDDRTKAVAAAEKQMAEEAKKAAKEEEEAYKASQKEAAQRVKTQEDLHNARQKEIEDAFKARDAEMAKMKLTEEEYNSVKQLKDALAGTAQEQMAAVQAIDIQNKSYNELYQTYNAIKDVLNQMTTAERENTEAGRAMTVQSTKIYDTMNELQKATGKYTMQVGKYRAAFDGLGYSFMQIAREAPSALNINQFFLAISNNIPMFLDQLKSFKNEQAEIKANLANMTEGTAEYAEQAGKVMSVGQKLLGVIKSWQFGILGILLLIRNIDWVKLWNNLKKTFQGVKEIKNEITSTAALGEMMVEVAKKTADEVSELNLVVDRLREVKAGTDEWKAGIETVNKITKKNLDTTTSTISEVEKVTEAYTKQAVQLAKNAALTDMIGKSEANKTLRKIAYDADDYETARQALGLSIDSKDEKAFREIYDKMLERESAMNKGGWSFRLPGDNRSNRQIYNEVVQEYRNFINKRLSVLSDDAKKQLEEEYELINPLSKEKKGGSYSLKDVDLLDSELLDKDAVIELESSFKQKLAMLEQQREKELLVLKEKYERAQKDLEFNKKKKLITEEEYEKQRATLDKNYNDLIKTNYEGNFEEMGVIQRKYWNKRNELAAKEAERQEREEEKKNAAALKEVKDEEKNFKAFQEIEKRKFELTKHTATEEKKFVMEQQMELLQWRIDHAAALGISPELLEVMKQEYAQMKKMYDLGKYSTGKQNIKGNYTSISDLLWPDLDSDQTSALNSVFDQAKEALNSWMDARKAAADQAKELADDEVAAAENALNREIELRNQGYANDVALKEKELAKAKENQKKSIELQQKYKEQELAINTAMEASNMAVAVANIFKQFTFPYNVLMAAAMVGAWGAAKISALNSIKSTKYREGGYMLLEGGSHQSGHDVNLGIGPDGSNLRAEGGEYFAVINKRNSRKYSGEIPGIVNALNSGMFEDRYIKTSDAVGMLPRVVATDNGHNVDLSAVESGVGELVKQGESRWSTEGEYRVMRYKNLTRRVRVS